MKKLFKALSEFKQEVPVIFKGTQGYGYKYADLPAIYAVITPLLAKHGIDFMQTLNTAEIENGETYLETIIMHIESGEHKISRCVIPQITLAKMNDYQSFGSGITYFRRYCLSVSLGIVTDIDNDATGAQTKKEQPKKSTKATLNTNQFNTLFGLIQSGDEDTNGTIWSIERANETFEFTSAQKKTLKNL